ncbi:hypothetical protein Cpir12675_005460 [Ceratocystis pirilliformis]|uniref:Uncharacterized protein n=1 Tax=Ceratocystis pirilliformis TaxID=259994 RepID=A0ABR3YQ82_9PEZI
MGSDDKHRGSPITDGTFSQSHSDGPVGGPSEPPPAFDDAIFSQPAMSGSGPVFIPTSSPAPTESPPQYAEIINADHPQPENNLLVPANPPFVRPLAKHLKWFSSDCYLDPQLDSDPAFLETWIRHVAREPIQMQLRISGQHTETRMNMHRDSDGRSRSRDHQETVEDFDFQIDLTAFLFCDMLSKASWTELRTVENHEKAYRGGIFRSRAHPFRDVKKLWRRRQRLWKGRRRDLTIADEESESAAILRPEAASGVSLGSNNNDSLDTLENSGLTLGGEEKPSLTEWCHRYCSSGLVRSFEVEKRVLGFDESYVRGRVTNLIRTTGYMGDVSITFPVDHARMTVFSSCYINEWRLMKWLRWAVILTLLVVLVWPYLFLRTRKFNVVSVNWWFSRRDEATGDRRFVSMSEDQILDFWQHGIQEAAMRKRRGNLHVGDAVSARDSHSRGQGAEAYRDVQGRMESAFYAASAMQRHTGWGWHC